MVYSFSASSICMSSFQLRSSDSYPFSPLPCRLPQTSLRRKVIKRAVSFPSRFRIRAQNDSNDVNSWADTDRPNVSGWSSDRNSNKKNNLKGYLVAGATGLVLTIGFAFTTRSLLARKGAKSITMAPLVVEETTYQSSGSTKTQEVAPDTAIADNSVDTVVEYQETKEKEELGSKIGDSIATSESVEGTNQSFLPNEKKSDPVCEDGNRVNDASVNYDSLETVKQQKIDPCVGDSVPPSSSEDELSNQQANSIDISDSSLPASETTNSITSEVDKAMDEKSPGTEFSSSQDLNNRESDILISSEPSSRLLKQESQDNAFDLVNGELAKEDRIIFPRDRDYCLPDDRPKDDITKLNEDIQAPLGITSDDNAKSSISQTRNESSVTQKDDVSSTVDVDKNDENITSEKDDNSETVTREADGDNYPPSVEIKGLTSEETINDNVVKKIDDVSRYPMVESVDLNVRKISMFESPLFDSESEQVVLSSGIPAPIRAVGSNITGKVVVPAAIDHFQAQAFAALQALKVIDGGADPSGLCTRREYARWLISSSAVLAKNPLSKVFPAMFIENFSELAFDDVTPEDPDFPYIQGLAEAGLISSKLSSQSSNEQHKEFCPDRPLSRQDLVSWKVAMEKRELPEVDRKEFWSKSGFLDIDKVHKGAWPALFADLASEQSIVSVAFGYTRLFQPDKPVTRAQAAAALATGEGTELIAEELARIEAETLADTAVAAHAALEAQVQEDLNASFKRELEFEREKVKEAERLAEEARLEFEKIQNERENEKILLTKEQAALDYEREFLSKLRNELEEQLQSFSRNKIEVSFERDEVSRLRKEAENEKQAMVEIRSEVEVEKKAMALARSWVEEEAKKAAEHARMLQLARNRWEKEGIKVYVDKDLEEVTTTLSSIMLRVEDQKQIMKPTLESGFVKALKQKDFQTVFSLLKEKLYRVYEKLIRITQSLLACLKQRTLTVSKRVHELQQEAVEKISKTSKTVQESTAFTVSSLTTSVGQSTKKMVEECKEGAEKLVQKLGHNKQS